MRTSDARVRALLSLYPRAYRERRGEEITATLFDRAVDGRLPAREVLGIVRHGLALRVRDLGAVAIVVPLALAGAGVGLGLGQLESPTAYHDTARVLRLGAIRATDATTTATLVAGIRHVLGVTVAGGAGQGAARIAVARSSASCTIAAGDLAAVLTCTAGSAGAAQEAAGLVVRDLQARYVLALRWRTVTQLAELASLQSATRARLVGLEARLHGAPAAARPGLARAVDRVAHEAMLLGRSVALVEASRRGVAMVVSDGTATPVPASPLAACAIGAATGLAAGLLFVVRRRRHRSRRLLAV